MYVLCNILLVSVLMRFVGVVFFDDLNHLQSCVAFLHKNGWFGVIFICNLIKFR